MGEKSLIWLALFALTAPVWIYLFVRAAERRDECDRVGGVMVRGTWGMECVRPAGEP